MSAIEIIGLNKTFTNNHRALDNVSLRLDRGEMVALIGASGSGKSTLLRHISGLTAADRNSGRISVLGRDLQVGGKLAKGARAVRADLGFVFQQFNLVNRLSVLTNVLLGTLGRISGWRGNLALFSRTEKQAAMAALHRVGIARAAGQRASTLSGGQQQRAAIARALVQKAQVILADEPIASLDPASSARVMETLAQINREDGITVFVSLHQVDYAIKYCPRTIAMRDGKVVYDGPSDRLTPEFLRELYGSDSEELMLGHRADHEEADATSRKGNQTPALAFASA